MSEYTDIPREVEASDLPAGETILWRGKPDWRYLAIDAFHAPLIAAYFGLIGSWHLMAALHDGATGSAALLEASGVVFPAVVALVARLLPGLAFGPRHGLHLDGPACRHALSAWHCRL